MPDPFDPYLEWLAIPAGQRPPDHYTLLGVKPTERDPEAIAQAADTQLARIRKLRPGEHARDWGRLLDEIEAAKVCLLDAGRRQAYDDQRARASFGTSASGAAPMMAMPPGMGWTTKAPMEAAGSGSMPVYGSPAPAVTMPPTMAMPPGAVLIERPAPPPTEPFGGNRPSGAKRLLTAAPLEENSSPTSRPIRKTDSLLTGRPLSAPLPLNAPLNAPMPPAEMMPAETASPLGPPLGPPPESAVDWPALLMGGSLKRWAATAAVVMAIVILGGILTSGLHSSPTDVAATDEASSEAEPAPQPPEPPRPAESSPGAGAQPPEPPPPVSVESRPIELNAPKSPETLPPEQPALPPGPATPAVPALTTDSAPPVVDPSLPTATLPGFSAGMSPPGVEPPGPEASPFQFETPAAAPGGTSGPPPGPETPATSPAIVTPAPRPSGPAATTQPATPAKQAAFGQAVAAVRNAMGVRDLDGAKGLLDTAAQSAETDANSAEIGRLRVLHHNLTEFWSGIREGVADLNDVGDIPLGDTRIAIVESSRDHIVLRAAGRNKRFATMELPTSFVIYIADRWFSKKAASSKVLIGSFLAVDPKGDRQRARELWQQATKEGLSCDDLMPELDRAATGGP